VNQFVNPPVINEVLSLLPLADATADVTGTSVDMANYPDNYPMLAVIQVGTVDNLDAAFVKLEESHNNVTFTPLAHSKAFSNSDETQVLPVLRTKRYVRAVLVIEFEQPDPENPVATTLPITAFLVR